MAVAAEVLLACLSVQGAVYWMTHSQSQLCPSVLHRGTLCVCNSAGQETSHCVSGRASTCDQLRAENKLECAFSDTASFARDCLRRNFGVIPAEITYQKCLNPRKPYTCRVMLAQVGAADVKRYNLTHCFEESMRSCSIVVASRDDDVVQPEPEPVEMEDTTTTTTTTTTKRPAPPPPPPSPRKPPAMQQARTKQQSMLLADLDEEDDYVEEVAVRAEGQPFETEAALKAVQTTLGRILYIAARLDAQCEFAEPASEAKKGGDGQEVATTPAPVVITPATTPAPNNSSPADAEDESDEEERLQNRRKRAEEKTLLEPVVNATRLAMETHMARLPVVLAPLFGVHTRVVVNKTKVTFEETLFRVVPALFERSLANLRQEMMQLQVLWIRPLTDTVVGRLDVSTAAIDALGRRVDSLSSEVRAMPKRETRDTSNWPFPPPPPRKEDSWGPEIAAVREDNRRELIAAAVTIAAITGLLVVVVIALAVKGGRVILAVGTEVVGARAVMAQLDVRMGEVEEMQVNLTRVMTAYFTGMRPNEEEEEEEEEAAAAGGGDDRGDDDAGAGAVGASSLGPAATSTPRESTTSILKRNARRLAKRLKPALSARDSGLASMLGVTVDETRRSRPRIARITPELVDAALASRSMMQQEQVEMYDLRARRQQPPPPQQPPPEQIEEGDERSEL